MKLTSLLVLLLSVICCAEAGVQIPYKSVIAVYDPRETVNTKCLNGIESKDHYNIMDLSKVIFNSTQVIICSSITSLSAVIEISHMSDLEIVGYDSPDINCSNSSISGLSFVAVQNLALKNFNVVNCAQNTEIDPGNYTNIKTAVKVLNCSNVNMTNITIGNGPGTGLAMFNTNGMINIQDCTFQNNGRDNSSGGNGAYMEISAKGTREEGITIYNIEKSTFRNNVANTGKDSTIHGFSRFDKGAGLCVYILNATNVALHMDHLNFTENFAAAYGGGLYINYVGGSKNNNVTVANSTFLLNKAKHGGALYLGYLHTRLPVLQTPLNSSIFVMSITFLNNSARFGGGVSFYSTKTENHDEETKVHFVNSTWKYNSGHYGSAVSVLPNAWNLYGEGYLPTPIFINCTFASNLVKDVLMAEGNENYYQFENGFGAFYCSRNDLVFKGNTVFKHNNGSALYLLLCLTIFYDYSKVVFENNTGYFGGAIYQMSSIVYVSNDATVRFISNSAYDKGGAIYQHTPLPHITDYSETCFIDYVDNIVDVNKRNITVIFENNQAGIGKNGSGYGHSIFASSLIPCYTRFKIIPANTSIDIFQQIGNFSFIPSNRTKDLATEVSSISTKEKWQNDIEFIAGKERALNFESYDDLKHQIPTDYMITVSNDGNSSITTQETFSSTRELALYGKTNDTGTITLEAITSRQIAILFRARIVPCPPGFVQHRTNGTFGCICSSETNSTYAGISKCNPYLVQAYRLRWMWVGYNHSTPESEDSLISGNCPSGYCVYSGNNLLPTVANKEELNDKVCSTSRHKILCSQCKDNHSVYFSNLNFDCKPSTPLCKWGWSIYVLSQLVPVTILFCTIMFFNIPFTAGIVNGFIFYIQVVQWFHITAYQAIPLSKAADAISRGHFFIQSMFNLQFFVLKELSFCLWEGANALDIVVFGYVTLLYSLLLIILVVFMLSKCNFRPRCKCFASLSSKIPSLHAGVTHGLTAFLILCYCQCSRTSMLLLASAQITGKHSHNIRMVVYYHGEWEFLGASHLRYAIPAILFSVVIVLLPPIILLVYPLHYKVLSLLKVGEVRYIQAGFRPLEKIRPLLDSFQSCFKDEYRFFSGLYFFYRFAIQLNMGLNYFQQTYVVLEVQLVVIFILHSICQPYKERLHNIIDTLIFGNLLVINALTMYNFSILNTGIYDDQTFYVTTWAQVILIVLPLLCMGLFLPIQALGFQNCYKMVVKQQKKANENEIKSIKSQQEEDFPTRATYGSFDSMET